MALEAMAKRPVEFAPEEKQTFSSRVHEGLTVLNEPVETSQVLIAAGSFAQAIEQYQGQTQRHFDNLIAEFRELISLLVERGAGLPAALKQSVEAALAATDLPRLENKLAQCLETLRASHAAAEPPMEPIGRSGAYPIGASVDASTGLPTRREAEAAIQRALEGSTPFYVVAFYLHRMQLINARFGDGIGNQVIQFCSQHIATNLSGANDALFRWRGPGFVAVIERGESALAVSSEIQRFTSMPLSRFFETPSRTVYLPIKLTGEVLPTADRSLEDIVEQVQKSLHSHGAETD